MLELVTENLITPEERRAFSIRRAAETLDVSEPFIRREIREGNLKAKKKGSRVLILSEWLEEYIQG